MGENNDNAETWDRSCKVRNECAYPNVFASVALLFPVLTMSYEGYLCKRLFKLGSDKIDQQTQLNVDDVLFPRSKSFRVEDRQSDAFAIDFLLQVVSFESVRLMRRFRQIFLDILLRSLFI